MKQSLLVGITTFIAILAAMTPSAEATRIVSLSLCENISEPGPVPISVKDKFGGDIPIVHAVVNLAEAAAGSILKGSWISVDAIETPNYEIDAAEARVGADGDATAHFSLSRPNNGWPVGNYRFDFYIDGRLATSAPFAIGANNSHPAFEGAAASKEGTASKQAKATPPTPPTPKAKGGLTGTYTLQSGQVTVTLAWRQGGENELEGALFSTTGMQYIVQGIVQDGVAVGTCFNDQGGSYFEGTLSGDQLAMTLIEPDANNQPDYSKTQQLIFTRQSSTVDEALFGQIQEALLSMAEEGTQQQAPGARGASSELMQHFSGTWVNMTKNSETRVTLTPDGGYYENYEASYSGGSSDSYGNQDMAWGAANQQQAQGQWQVQGTAERGVITLQFNDGSTREIRYEVHVENGETYWGEYWFNGDLYGKEK